jgi:hypothetical protein
MDSLGLKRSSFYQINYPDHFSFRTNDASGIITLYRGVERKENISEILKFTEENGFLSKVALSDYLENKDIEKALAASIGHANEHDLRTQVINHVIGDWVKETSLISTSFNKEVAIRSAGVGGYLFTIKIDIKKGIFASEPKYWSEWHTKSNPNARLHEFMIPNQIKPENITQVEEVLSIPKEPLKDSFSTTFKMLKSIPWYCNRFFKKKSN